LGFIFVIYFGYVIFGGIGKCLTNIAFKQLHKYEKIFIYLHNVKPFFAWQTFINAY